MLLLRLRCDPLRGWCNAYRLWIVYLLLGTSKLLHASLVLLTLKEKMSVSTQVISAYTFITELSIIHRLNFSYKSGESHHTMH